MKGTIVYVYALINEEGQVNYIGKSSSPKARLYGHLSSQSEKVLNMKILDIFHDTESYWISKFLEEGNALFNKEVDIYEEKWEVGDIITVGKRVTRKVLNKSTGEVYKSMYDVNIKTRIPYHQIQEILKNPKSTLREQYPLEYVN